MRLAAARSSKVARSTRPPDVLMTAPENAWRSKAWMPALAFTKSLRQARDSWACGLLQAYGLGKELRLRHHRRRSAGCVVANRLTADRDTNVLVLEAGGWD